MKSRIESVTSIADLSVISPSVLKDPKKDHPRFVEFQKKQMTLWILISKIEIPKYKEIQKNIITIYEAKELWTPELQELDLQIQNILKNPYNVISPKNTLSTDIQGLMNQKNTLIQKMNTSQEYKDYIQKNQAKLASLNTEMKTFWTPEIITLQQEVVDIGKEIYGNTTQK